MNDHLTEIYYSPQNPGSYSGINSFYEIAKKKFPDLTRKYVNQCGADPAHDQGDARVAFRPPAAHQGLHRRLVHPPTEP